MLTDKAYLMSPEEQMASGLFWGIPIPVTSRYVKSMVGPQLLKLLKF
jgi:hypothetical protein